MMISSTSERSWLPLAGRIIFSICCSSNTTNDNSYLFAPIMSTAQFSGGAGAGKKAVHVKWAGKTIALGTFPSAEADEKCAKAKALTRAWRSTMRPKPTREWVMVELERLGVRVVSGRLGRKAGEDGDDDMGSKRMDPNAGLGWGTDADINQIMARRSSSLGLSMMSEGRRGSLSSLGQVVGLDGADIMPPHRPLVGGGAAAAFEAARHDHYTNKAGEQQRRASSLGLGTLGGGLGGMSGMSVNPNQHYEMLKLHHMNLLNEIQETTLMMNLYQQQQLQQQQAQLQAESGNMGGDMGMLSSGMGGSDMFSSGNLSQRSSLGLGGQLGGNFSAQQLQMMQQGAAHLSVSGGEMKPETGSGEKRGGEGADGEPEAKKLKSGDSEAPKETAVDSKESKQDVGEEAKV